MSQIITVMPMETTTTTTTTTPNNSNNMATVAVIPVSYNNYNHDSLPHAQVNIMGSNNNNSNNNSNNSNYSNVYHNNNANDIPVATAVPVGYNMYGWMSPRGWNDNHNMLPVNNNHIHPYDETLTPRQIFLISVHKICKLIRVISFIEISLIIIIGIVLPVYFILIPFPLCGYYGARRYSNKLLYVYIVYIALNFLGGIISIFFIKNLIYIVFRLVYLTVNVTIFRYIVRLCGFISEFHEDDYDFVLNSSIIQNIDRATMC